MLAVRTVACALVPLLLSTPAVLAQTTPAPSGVFGGVLSRFLPTDLVNRLQERPGALSEAIVFTAPIDSVWGSLRTALPALEIPIQFDDPGGGEIGNAEVKARRRLGKLQMASLVRCGSGATGPNADTYMVYLTVVVFAKKLDAGGTAILPLVTGHAVDPTGGRGDAVNCTSTGRLEARIGAEVQQQLSGGAPDR